LADAGLGRSDPKTEEGYQITYPLNLSWAVGSRGFRLVGDLFGVLLEKEERRYLSVND